MCKISEDIVWRMGPGEGETYSERGPRDSEDVWKFMSDALPWADDVCVKVIPNNLKKCYS